ncbi:unnamed protein product [Thlaspi arvense]|uniref:HhH-GPD domain-containing protein n=1 Tax=Thlaspi arvense TaxID=13288 RepID=A0AAU9SAC2_THLAR|nr:unnamed protein product [Thlaspi arvense]
MDKQGSSIQPPSWIPQTPIKPIAPVNPNRNQAMEERFIGNKEMIDLEHLSFGDLLNLANTAKLYISGHTGTHQSKMVCGEMLQKGDEALSSVTNSVTEQITTPEKPKRKKHRPKVVKEDKPKRVPKPKPAVEGQESKTPKRKYVRKKKEVNKDQESTPVEVSPAVEASGPAKKICRRALDFEVESCKPENRVNQSNSSDAKPESDNRGKQTDSRSQEPEGCPIPLPGTPRRKTSQSKRKGKESRINGAQAAKRRQGKETTWDTNLSGIQYVDLCEYQKMHWLCFNDGQQKETRSDAIISTSLAGDAQEDVSAFDSSCYIFTSQGSASTFQGRQSFESSVGLEKTDKPIKNRTTGQARFRSLSSITEASEKLQAGRVLVKTQATSSKTKKRATKSMISKTNQNTPLPNLGLFQASSTVRLYVNLMMMFFPADLPPQELWTRCYSVEAITEDLRVLDINREFSETALVPYAVDSTGNQIVIFTGGAGAIVPSTPVKKRPPRAKVDLDNETDRMWKLLMENIDSEGVDGSDEQKAKWWEEERNVFRGRANTFISRMHLVQGDRRFTPWKGSVVDSVVGVFLTQNVSDHLSSSAFMSLAAEYPPKEVPVSNFDVGTSSMPSIKITYLDSEESMSNPTVVHNQSSVTFKNTEPGGEKDYVNSNETSRSSSEIASTDHESVGITRDPKDSSVEVDNTDQTYLVPSEDSAVTFQSSLVSDAPQHIERLASSSEINSEKDYYTAYLMLRQSLESALQQGKGRDIVAGDSLSVEESKQKKQQEVVVSRNVSPSDCSSYVKEDFESLKGQTKSSDDSNEPFCCFGDLLRCEKPDIPESSSSVPSTKHKEGLVRETMIPDLNESTSCIHVQEGTENPESKQNRDSPRKDFNPVDEAKSKAKGKKVLKEKKEGFDWDSLRREAEARVGKRGKTSRTMDSVDWEAIRTAHVDEVAETIKSRGMNHKLAERIQGFLNRLVTDHESIDLEWLRDVPPDKVKEYLMSFKGLGLKSVECVRLLTLHHLAFPVDTNVGRIAVRLGWVPLQPLPESLQLHLLEMYPVLESIQKYLWPRLCKLDQKTLYELHYQMITFGKVFCTKSKPNCNACPMRGECRHFASAFASARLSLPSTEKGMETPDKKYLPLHLPETLQREQGSEVVHYSALTNRSSCCEPIIEEPASPEPPECAEVSIADIEEAFYEDPEEIPTIRLNMDAFANNLKKIIEHNTDLQDGDMSTALVALTAEAASLPMPKLKSISQLRTEHRVYELGDSHPLVAQFEKREPDDPCPYLLAIWTPGETIDSIEPAVSKCISQGIGKLCNDETCLSCSCIREAKSQTIPCRTATGGSFPLNGTYFQVNEVFADHDSSLTPINIPRDWLWDLPRRTVYFGTSIPSIFKGLSTETIQQCFWRGFVCVRGIDRITGGPKPLIARLHFPASKMKSQANPPKPGAV